MNETVRTRFAPSPTGRLHLGNARIAVFNWLFTRRHGGSFILRIEDTDPARTVPGSEAGILDDLRWLGLDWDEGPDVGGPHVPYRQSEREELHRKAALALVEAGKAYPCWCTAEELSRHRVHTAGGEILRYPGTCRDLSDARRREMDASGRPPVVRFRMPMLERVEVEDAVRGEVVVPASDLDDFVLLRADGRATYNLAVVVDDVGMEITHVIRGAGHLSNTPKQALLFDALDHPRPRFAHLPTVLGPDGHPLSKRHGSQALDRLRAEGYNPTGVVNYLSLLGWSSPDEREVFALDELIERVSLERLGAADTTLDPEKLRWMSGQHIAREPLEAVVDAVRPWLDGTPVAESSIQATVEALRSRLHHYGEIREHLALIHPPEAELAATRGELLGDPAAAEALTAVRAGLARETRWEAPALGAAVRAAGAEAGVSGARLFHPVRQALTGKTSGPDLGLLLAALGRREALARMDAALGMPGEGKRPPEEGV